MRQETPPSEAREFCRRLLPRVSRTFAINIELLNEPLREPVRTAYLLCRAADALEDSWPGAPGEIQGRFAALGRVLGGDVEAAESLAAGARRLGGSGADLALLSDLPKILVAYGTLPEEDRSAIATGVGTMAAGMSRYSARAAGRAPGACYVDDEDELHDYCWVVAGCVGVMLTQLLERRLGPGPDPLRERRREAAPIVGEALQLTNILLDWPSDVRKGRCYLPASWLARHGLAPADLANPARPEAREIALRLEALAHAALDRVPDYLETIPPRHVRYRLFCLWPALWARASLRIAHRDPEFPWSARRPRITRGELWSAAARSLLVAHSHRGVRRLLAGGASS